MSPFCGVARLVVPGQLDARRARRRSRRSSRASPPADVLDQTEQAGARGSHRPAHVVVAEALERAREVVALALEVAQQQLGAARGARRMCFWLMPSTTLGSRADTTSPAAGPAPSRRPRRLLGLLGSTACASSRASSASSRSSSTSSTSSSMAASRRRSSSASPCSWSRRAFSDSTEDSTSLELLLGVVDLLRWPPRRASCAAASFAPSSGTTCSSTGGPLVLGSVDRPPTGLARTSSASGTAHHGGDVELGDPGRGERGHAPGRCAPPGPRPGRASRRSACPRPGPRPGRSAGRRLRASDRADGGQCGGQLAALAGQGAQLVAVERLGGRPQRRRPAPARSRSGRSPGGPAGSPPTRRPTASSAS